MAVNKISDLPQPERMDTEGLDKITKEELMGETFVVWGFVIRESAYDESAEYCMIKVGNETEPTHVWNTSGKAIRGTLEQAKKEDFFPFQVTLGEGTTKQGRKFLRFE